MPLVGYLKSTDPGRISSITNLDGDKERRKKIEPIALFSNSLYVTLYVVDCISHDPPGSVVPVLLKRFEQGTGWVELGVARCCPLCWLIIQPPVGQVLPEPQELLVAKREGKDGGSRIKVGRRKNQVSDTAPMGYQHTQSILQLAGSREAVSVYDVMTELGLSRTVCLKYLRLLVSTKKLIKDTSPGGPGNLSLYRKAP